MYVTVSGLARIHRVGLEDVASSLWAPVLSSLQCELGDSRQFLKSLLAWRISTVALLSSLGKYFLHRWSRRGDLRDLLWSLQA